MEDTGLLTSGYKFIREERYNFEQLIEYIGCVGPEDVARDLEKLFYGIAQILIRNKSVDCLNLDRWNDYLSTLENLIESFQWMSEKKITDRVEIESEYEASMRLDIGNAEEKNETIRRMIDEKEKDIEYLKEILVKRTEDIEKAKLRIGGC